MENVTNVIISLIEIIPCGNLSNISTKENIAKDSWNDGKNHIIKNATIEITAATIWFSVILDANIPNDIYAKLSNKKPPKVESATINDGFPK